MVPNQAPAPNKKDDLRKALETLADVVVGGEFNKMRQAIASTKVSVNNGIDKTKQNLLGMIDNVRKELGQHKHETSLNHNTLVKRVEQEYTSRSNLVDNIEKRIDSSVDVLRENLDKDLRIIQKNIDNVEKSMEEEIAVQKMRIIKRIESIEKAIVDQNQTLLSHQEEVKQVSQLLNNFAGVFAGAGMFRTKQPKPDQTKTPTISDFVKPAAARPAPISKKSSESDVIDEAIITHLGTKKKLKT